MSQFCVLLYSHYSQKSTELLTVINNCPINLTDLTGLSYLCIDNKKIRQQITSSKNIIIESVPTLLILNNGQVEKFEGNKVFEWIDEIVRYNLPPQPPPPQLPPPPPPQLPEQPAEYILEDPIISSPSPPPQRKVRKSKPKPPPPPVEEDEFSEEDYEPPPPARPKRKPHKKVVIEKDDESDLEIPKRPPAGVRNGPGGYDLSEEFGEPEEPNRDYTSKIKPNTDNVTQGSSLMAMAQQMQKDREAN